jgi:flagellar motor switch protein FliG
VTVAADNVRKSALVLIAMGAEQADQVLRQLGPEAVKKVTRELAQARNAPPVEQAAALREFLRAADEVSEEHVIAPAPASASNAPPAGPFASFYDAETATLRESIRDEHPQTIALVLAHLPPHKASELLAGLPSSKQVEVVKRIAGIEQISSEVIEQVERGLRQRLGSIMGRTVRSGGISAVAEILNAAGSQVENKILSTLEADSPQLAEQIRRVQAIFEDLLHASDEDVRSVLEQLDHDTISLSMRTAREGLKRKVLWNLPAEEARQIERELHSVTPVTIQEIEAAQQRVAEVVSRLEASGEINVSRARDPEPESGMV